jgi:hypothetical protein
MLNYHKKFSSKNLPNTKKMGDQWQWLSSINLVIILYKQENVKFCIQLQQNYDLHYQKAYKNLHIIKTFKQFFYISNCFQVIRCQIRLIDANFHI